MGIDERGFNRGGCAKQNCFCSKFVLGDAKSAGAKKVKKKERGMGSGGICKQCGHWASDHLVQAEDITTTIKQVEDPGKKTLAPVEHKGNAHATTAKSYATGAIAAVPMYSAQPQCTLPPPGARLSPGVARVAHYQQTHSPTVSGAAQPQQFTDGSAASRGGSNAQQSLAPFGAKADFVCIDGDVNAHASSSRGGLSPRYGADARNGRGTPARGGLSPRTANRSTPTQASGSGGSGGGGGRGSSRGRGRRGTAGTAVGSGSGRGAGGGADGPTRAEDTAKLYGRNFGLIGPTNNRITFGFAGGIPGGPATVKQASLGGINRGADGGTNRGGSTSSRGGGGSAQKSAAGGGYYGGRRGGSASAGRGSSAGGGSTSNSGYSSAARSPQGGSGGGYSSTGSAGTGAVGSGSSAYQGPRHGMVCVACGQGVHGAFMDLSGSVYHDTCTSCSTCGKSLFQEPFYNTSDTDCLYCEACYINIAATKCHNCHQPITDGGLSTMGKTYHGNCFSCSKCSAPLPQGTPFFNCANEPTCGACAY